MKALWSLNIKSLLTGLNETLASLAERMDVSPLAFFLLAALVALLAGLAGVALARVLTSCSMGLIGCFFGSAFVRWLAATETFADTPSFMVTLGGVFFGVLFFLFGWRCCRLSVGLLFGLIGVGLVAAYAPFENVYLFFGVALACGVPSWFIGKVAFDALTSAVGGFVFVNLLGQMLPSIPQLNLIGGGAAPIWIGVGCSVLFFVFQAVTARKCKLS